MAWFQPAQPGCSAGRPALLRPAHHIWEEENIMGRPRLIDLTMEIYQGMPTYPSVAKPFVHELENHEQMARSTGAWQYGLTHAPNHCVIVSGDHIGTHLDAWGHVKPGATRAEGIQQAYCH